MALEGRSLQDAHFATGGSVPLHTDGGFSTLYAVSPFKAQLVAMMLSANVDVDPPSEQTFDIFVNDADIGVDLRMPTGLLEDESALVYPDSEVFLNPGDNVYVESNGENVTAGNALVGFLLRSMEARDLRVASLYGGDMSTFQTATSQPAVGAVVPRDGEIIGVVAHIHNNASDALSTVNILKNGVDTGIDFLFPSGILVGAGAVCSLSGAPIPVRAGDLLLSESNGEQIAASNLGIGYLFRSAGNQREIYLYGGRQAALQTNLNQASDAAMLPGPCRIIGAAIHVEGATDAVSLPDARINGEATPAVARLVIPNGMSANTGQFVGVDQQRFGIAGARLRAQSATVATQTGACAVNYTWIVERE